MLVVINSLLIGYKAQRTEEKSCLELETLSTYRATGVMDLRKVSTTSILLDQHNSLRHSKSYAYNHRTLSSQK